MNIWITLSLLLFIPFALFIGTSRLHLHLHALTLTAYLILSTCLGDRVRARFNGIPLDLNQHSYGRTYAKNLGSNMSQGGWENIEMQDMYDRQDLEDH